MHGGPGNSGMMGRESAREMGMMQNMMGMMSARSGMMGSHFEGRLASLKADLKITEAQTKLWNAFAAALRSSAESMTGMYGQMMRSGPAVPLPERLALMDTQMAAHLANLENVKQALDSLYATFSPEQKKRADRTMIGPMGMM